MNLPKISEIWRGVLAAITIGAAGMFIAERFGGSQVLYALILGMAFNFMSDDPKAAPGLQFCSARVLRVGVGLLGAKISADQIALLSPALVILLIFGVFSTVGVALLLNRFTKWPKAEAALAGASCAICGASAAIALASVADKNKIREQALLAVVVAVTAFSTLVMVCYPFLCQVLELDLVHSGFLLGGSIHDVAQVVGAGTMMGQEALETATMTKMFRVACLIPMLLLFTALFAPRAEGGEGKKSGLTAAVKRMPLFLLGFIALAALNCLGFIPKVISDACGVVSSLCILVSIAALGMRTKPSKLLELGMAPIILMAGSTFWLLCVVLTGVLILPL